jgi:hypothetical protein
MNECLLLLVLRCGAKVAVPGDPCPLPGQAHPVSEPLTLGQEVMDLQFFLLASVRAWVHACDVRPCDLGRLMSPACSFPFLTFILTQRHPPPSPAL